MTESVKRGTAKRLGLQRPDGKRLCYEGGGSVIVPPQSWRLIGDVEPDQEPMPIIPVPLNSPSSLALLAEASRREST